MCKDQNDGLCLSWKRLMLEKYTVMSRYCTVRRECSIGIGRQTVPENLIWNLVCCTRAVTVFLSIFSMWSDARCHVPCKIPLAMRAVAMCANVPKIKVYYMPLRAAVLMRSLQCPSDRITDRPYLILKNVLTCSFNEAQNAVRPWCDG